ncbi:MAG TPA: hypothetical protein H9896_00570 [Candidatus Pygmaiobacter gallistercoris]|nr:hypothetical protein [Candidatus Pygmaiobacter gallistercoris]
MICPQCGRLGRIYRVDEYAEEGIRVIWICTNRQCGKRGERIGEEILPRKAEDKAKVLQP